MGKLGLRRLNLLGNLIQLRQHCLVVGCNLRNFVNGVQQIRKAVGPEEDRPIGDFTTLLHGADTNPVLLIELGLPGLGIVQFLLLFCNQLVISLDLGV